MSKDFTLNINKELGVIEKIVPQAVNTETEIINWMKNFQIIKENDFILTGQSIMNWLNNTCNKKKEKNEIINRHIETSELYKSMVNYSALNDDIFVDIKHLMILTQKVK